MNNNTKTNNRYRKKAGVQEFKFKFRVYPTEGDIASRLRAIRSSEGIAPYVKRLIREDLIRDLAHETKTKLAIQNDVVEMQGQSNVILIAGITHADYIRLCNIMTSANADFYMERAHEFLRAHPYAKITASTLVRWYNEDNEKDLVW